MEIKLLQNARDVLEAHLMDMQFSSIHMGTIEILSNGDVRFHFKVDDLFNKEDYGYCFWRGFTDITIEEEAVDTTATFWPAFWEKLRKIPNIRERELRYAISQLAKIEGVADKIADLEVKATLAGVFASLSEMRLLLEAPKDEIGSFAEISSEAS